VFAAAVQRGRVGIRYAHPAWIFASISTLESSGIISSGIGTRSWMGMPCSTIASCFMLRRPVIVSTRPLFLLVLFSLPIPPGSARGHRNYPLHESRRRSITYFDMDSIRSILVIPSQWRICNGNPISTSGRESNFPRERAQQDAAETYIGHQGLEPHILEICVSIAEGRFRQIFPSAGVVAYLDSCDVLIQAISISLGQFALQGAYLSPGTGTQGS